MAPPDGSHTDPFGVPIASTVAGRFAAGTSQRLLRPARRRPRRRHLHRHGAARARQPVPAGRPARRPRSRALPDVQVADHHASAGSRADLLGAGPHRPAVPGHRGACRSATCARRRSGLPDQGVPRRHRPRLHRPAPGRVGPRARADERRSSTTTSGPTARRRRPPSTSARRSRAASTTTRPCDFAARADLGRACTRTRHLRRAPRTAPRSATPGEAGLATDPITTATLPLPGRLPGLPDHDAVGGPTRRPPPTCSTSTGTSC